MKIFILRHADAENAVTSDYERQLSPKGHDQMQALTSFLAKDNRQNIAEIWHSPLIRACETAAIFKEQLALDAPLVESDDLSPSTDIQEVATRILKAHRNIALVGHNPHLELLVSAFLRSSSVVLKKAGLLCLQRTAGPTENTLYGTWALRWYIVPQLLIKSSDL